MPCNTGLPQTQQQRQENRHGDRFNSTPVLLSGAATTTAAAESPQPPVNIDAYDNLRRLVEQIIEQVFRLPELLDCSGVSPAGQQVPRPAEFDPKKYEELLATAVLNRVSLLVNWRRQAELNNKRFGVTLCRIGASDGFGFEATGEGFPTI